MTNLIGIKVPVGSMGTTPLQIDPWAKNPLVDGFRAKNPELAKAALAERPAPTLFESGDLPPFTASGTDPQFLSWLPFGCRHHAASQPSAAAVLQLIEQLGKDPNATIEHDGLSDYIRRVVDWITGRNVAMAPKAEEVAYDQVFGAVEAAERARTQANRAAQADFVAMRTRTGPYADGLGRGVR